jgi:hypothetical protein
MPAKFQYPETQPGSRGLFISIILLTVALFCAGFVGWLVVASAPIAH